MSISRLARSIPASPTFALNEEARILRERGEPVINMGIGEPKNKAPITAILSTAAKVVEGDIKYTPPMVRHLSRRPSSATLKKTTTG